LGQLILSSLSQSLVRLLSLMCFD